MFKTIKKIAFVLLMLFSLNLVWLGGAAIYDTDHHPEETAKRACTELVGKFGVSNQQAHDGGAVIPFPNISLPEGAPKADCHFDPIEHKRSGVTVICVGLFLIGVALLIRKAERVTTVVFGSFALLLFEVTVNHYLGPWLFK